ncbi:MAG: tRNA guanosine(15) transglycosylase TgtA [Candidatus Altiarchaeota archaeon]
MEFDFEIKNKDVGGRIGLLRVNGRTAETPALMPVYSPTKPLISTKELRKKFGAEVLMTNSYIMLKNAELKKKVLSKGVHNMLGFKGIIATDSGSFQLMSYGNIQATNHEIIEFQNNIGSDIGSFLDIPSLPDSYKPRAEEQLNKTLARADEALNADFLVNAGVQGAKYLDLREKAAKALGKKFNMVAVGGIVPLMEAYRFSELVDIIATVKKNIPSDRIVHAFGLGHPMIFSLAVALGVDLFDSAAYALYAKADRYITAEGTRRLSELEHISCLCPVCNKFGLELKELDDERRVKAIAEHNLYVTFSEIKRIKQAIREGSLWELLLMRVRAHPRVFESLDTMLKHNRWLSTLDPITKDRAFYVTGPESRKRTEVVNAKARLKYVSSDDLVELPAFGKVPAALLELHPFSTLAESSTADDLSKFKAILEYQFRAEADTVLPKKIKLKRSKTSGRLRYAYHGKEMIAAVRAKDGFIIPKGSLLKSLHDNSNFPNLRVVVEDDAVPFIKEGKSVFAKFVTAVDKNLRAGDEVLIVDRDDNLIRAGTLTLAPQEALDFNRGVAVRIR